MNSIFAERLLCANGWEHNKRVKINSQGYITEIEDAQICPSDFHSEMLLPGFINLHSHSFQWSMAGLAENFGRKGDSFWSWRELMYQFVQQIEAEDLAVIAEALYIDMLKAGYTEVGEFHYLHHDLKGKHYSQPELLSLVVIDAATRAGIAICHLPVLYQQAGFEKQPLNSLQLRFKQNLDEFLQLNQILNKSYAEDPLVKIGIAPHSLRAVSMEQLIALNDVIEDNTVTHIHIAEQKAEVEQSIATNGKTPVNFLYENLKISNNWCLIHATHLQSEEITKIANSDATVGLCPTTEANLGDGIFPLTEYCEQLGQWGIGSDSHVCIDPKQELLLLEYGQRLNSLSRVIYSSDNNPATATNLLIDSAKGGRKALQSSAGIIEVGARADFINLKIPSPFNHYNSQQIISKWLYSSRENWIDDVMVGGNWVVLKGQHHRQQYINDKLAKVLKKLN